MNNFRIATTETKDLIPQGTPGQRSYNVLNSFLMSELGEKHAALFAEPVNSEDGAHIDWYSDGTEVTILGDLPEVEQAKVRQTLERLGAEIKSLAATLEQKGDGPSRRFAEALKNATRIPGRESVYVVKNPKANGNFLQPVLVDWAFLRKGQEVAKSSLADLFPPIVPAQRRPNGLNAEIETSGASKPENNSVKQITTVAAVGSAAALPWRIIWWIGWALLVLLLAIVFWLLISACGVRGPFSLSIDFCPVPASTEIERAAAQQNHLESEILRLEREIAVLGYECQSSSPNYAINLESSVVRQSEQRSIVQTQPAAPIEAAEIQERLDRAGARRGELSFSLAWRNRSDVDLYVTCPPPGKVEINFQQKVSSGLSCAGELDIDANVRQPLTSEPVENIWFSRAADGIYTIAVVVARSRIADPVHSFTLNIQEGEHVDTISGTTSKDKPWIYYFERGKR